ncbi:cation diffusion facilitator family transporter [Aeromicrobium sp. IC_218]|uniref:cation diffusion facilitator family transporter n=1 Tax=Aeromicrobium sp. IC_218 TaxID=2545468 RepID=UPI00103A6F2B|nr:cation diffusion facilitator family transporter [Aeromicrobium sp. IC_218]TCJ00804.1 cation diffusion facilitator family transporter [Aeromicrobium sp. IC_218]
MTGGHAGHSHVHADEHPHPHEHDGHQHHTGLRGLVASIFAPHSHDTADSIDDALESSREGIRALKISLVALGLTAIVQAAIVVLTGSVALLADTVHNFSDALTAVPLWIAFVLVRRPATARYTYGFGKAEDVAGLFIVLMIALSALVAGVESVRRLIDPQTVTHPWVVLAAGVVGFAGNEFAAIYRIRVGRRIGSAALVADGLHARTDGFTSLAVAVGAIGVLLGFPLADPLVGLLITVAILTVLRSAARDVFRRLLDGVDPVLVERSRRTLLAVDGVAKIPETRLRWVGHQLFGDATITIAGRPSAEQVLRLADDCEHAWRLALPKLTDARVRVQASPSRAERPGSGS